MGLVDRDPFDDPSIHAPFDPALELGLTEALGTDVDDPDPVVVLAGQLGGHLGFARSAVRLAHRCDESADHPAGGPVVGERLVGH